MNMNKFNNNKNSTNNNKVKIVQNFSSLISSDKNPKNLIYSNINHNQYDSIKTHKNNFTKNTNNYIYKEKAFNSKEKYFNKNNKNSYKDFSKVNNMRIKSDKKQVNENPNIRTMSARTKSKNINTNIKNFNIFHNINNFNNNNNYNNYRNINLIRNENSNNNIKLIVKKENNLNDWIQKNIKNYQKKKEKTENLSINARFEMMLKLKEKDNINEILELSNERIAIKIGNKLKIYSLKTFKLLTKIDEHPIDKYIELVNKDLVVKNYSFIYFYKLLDTEQYQLFQTIEEKSTVNCIVKLMNGNLLLTCNDMSINIYGKEGNTYKLLSQNNNEKDCGDAIEIEDNKVVIFKKSNHSSDREYQIFLYDILTQNKKIIMNDF